MRSESYSHPSSKKYRLPQRSATENTRRKVYRAIKHALKSHRTSSSAFIEDDLDTFEITRNLTKAQSKKLKYFSEKQDKNIFKKLLTTTHQERSNQFKKLFLDKKQVDEDEIFLSAFSCAYHREILCQGRMFVTQRSICFHSNIFGWETLVVIPLSEIVKISKERAAMIFPNSIQITNTKGDKFFFASFVSRDRVFQVLELVLERFKNNEPVSPEETWEMMNASDKSLNGSIHSANTASSTPVIGKSSLNSLDVSSGDDLVQEEEEEKFEKMPEVQDLVAESFEEPEASCECAEHQGKLLMDAVFDVSTANIKELLFNDSPWFNKFNEELKNSSYTSSLWARDKSGLDTRTCTYTIALNHAMAPKSCTANERQVLNYLTRQIDGFTVEKETQNAGVPYSDNFSVIVKYCVTRVSEQQSRVRVHGYVNYKKNTWNMIRGYIEKSAYQGMEDHYVTLERMLKAETLKLAAKRKKTTDSEKSDTASMGSFDVEDPQPAAVSEQTLPQIPTRLETIQEVRSSAGHVVDTTEPDSKWKTELRVAFVVLAVFLFFIIIFLWNISSGIAIMAEKQSATTTIDLLQQQVAELKKQVDRLSMTSKQEL